MPDITVVELESQKLVGMRTRTSMATIGDDIGRLAGAAAAALAPNIAGPCVSLYLEWEETGGEILVGYPSSSKPPEGCTAEALPSGRAAVLTHVGGYEGLAGAWAAIKTGMAAQGLVGRSPPWEEYIDDCAVTAAEQLRTRIVWPIE